MKWRPKFSLLTLLLLTVLAGCGLLLWRDWAPWRLEREIKLGHSRETEYVSMKFSPDMRWMVLGAARYLEDHNLLRTEEMNALEVWDLSTGEKLSTVKHASKISGFALSSNALVATLSETVSELRVWNGRNGELVKKTALRAPGDEDPVFSPDGKKVVVGRSICELGENNGARSIGKEAPSVEVFMTEETSKKLRAEEHSRALTAFSATTLRELDERTHDIYVRACASRSGRWLFTMMCDTGIQVWDLATEKKVGDIEGGFDADMIRDAYFSADDSRMSVIIDKHGSLEFRESLIVELPSGRRLGKIPADARGNVRGDITEHFSANGEHLIFENRDALFLCTAGRWLWKLPNKNLSPFSLSPDGKRISVRRWDDGGSQYVCILETELGHTLAELRHGADGHGDEVQLFSPDGQRLYTNAVDSILVWRRVRPEMQWGVVCLPEFWALIVCAFAVAWSLRRDRRLFR